MKELRKFVLFVVVGVWFWFCCKDSNTKFIQPQIPHYCFVGTVTDWKTEKVLSDIPVELTASTLLYNNDFETVHLKSDKYGNFTIDPVYPGTYILRLFRETYPIKECKLEVGHKDLSGTYKLPEILYTRRMRTDTRVYKGHPMAINGSLAWIWGNPIVLLKANGNEWVQTGTLENPLKDKYISSIAFGDSVVYACQPPDTIVVLRTKDASILKRCPHGPKGSFIYGLAYDRDLKTLYSCSKTAIYRYSESLDKFDDVYYGGYPARDKRTMAYNQQLYIYDNTDLVCRKYDYEINEVGIYALVEKETETVFGKLEDMDFDEDGKLWVNTAK